MDAYTLLKITNRSSVTDEQVEEAYNQRMKELENKVGPEKLIQELKERYQTAYEEIKTEELRRNKNKARTVEDINYIYNKMQQEKRNQVYDVRFTTSLSLLKMIENGKKEIEPNLILRNEEGLQIAIYYTGEISYRRDNGVEDSLPQYKIQTLLRNVKENYTVYTRLNLPLIDGVEPLRNKVANEFLSRSRLYKTKQTNQGYLGEYEKQEDGEYKIVYDETEIAAVMEYHKILEKRRKEQKENEGGLEHA